MENISLREWIDNYRNGLYDVNDSDTMIDAGWYDWFCCCDINSLYTRLKN